MFLGSIFLHEVKIYLPQSTYNKLGTGFLYLIKTRLFLSNILHPGFTAFHRPTVDPTTKILKKNPNQTRLYTALASLGLWTSTTNKVLAMTYFHMRKPHTIIGAQLFHFWVRDGIRWFQSAMVARKTGFKETALSDSPFRIKIEASLKNNSGYMVKTFSQLVQVSFTHFCASTPCLSTS